MFKSRNGMFFAGWILAVVFLMGTMAVPARADQRVALVIGNADYLHGPSLATPLNDASDVAGALERLGFAVDHAVNADQAALLRGIRTFATLADAAQMAVVYYAGYGVAAAEQNFLVPTDAQLSSEQDLEFEAVPLSLIERAVSRSLGLGVIILDASRENPFPLSMPEGRATRSIGRGLAKTKPLAGTLVAYAAKEGTVASEGQGRNSLYTENLLRYLEEPGLEVEQVFRKVREAVLSATGGNQESSVYGSLSGVSAHLAPPPLTAEGPEAASNAENEADEDKLTAEMLAAERLFWESMKDSDDPAEIQTYLDQFPDGTYAALARVRLNRLIGEGAGSTEAAGIPDAETQETPAQAGSALDPEAAEEALGLQRDDRRLIQAGLKALGFDPGPLDGLFGRGTRAAISKWQSSEGRPPTGHLDPATAKTLAKAGAAAPPANDGPMAQVGLLQSPETTLTIVLQAASDIEDAYIRANIFADIGATLTQAGDTRRAARCLDLAMTAAEGGQGENHFELRSALSTIIKTMAKLGDAGLSARTITRVKTIAQRVEDDEDRASAFSDIAEAQAKAGDALGAAESFQRALDAVAEITHQGTQDSHLFNVANSQMRAGDFLGARTTAGRITHKESRAISFCSIAEAQAKAGDAGGAAHSIRQALTIAQQIREDADRLYVLNYIAEAQAETGDSEGAANSVKQLLARSDDIRVDWTEKSPLIQVTATQARLGDFHGAFSTALRIKDDDQRDWAFKGISATQARLGDLHGAFSTALRIKDDNHRAWAFKGIAEAQVEAGDAAGTARSMRQALAAAAQFNEGEADYLLRNLGKTQARLGDFRGALATAQRIEKGAYDYAHLMIRIAVAQADAGDAAGAAHSIQRALTSVQRIKDDDRRLSALQQIAQAQISNGIR